MVTIPPINMVILGMVYGIVLTTFYENETKTDISWYSDVAILHSFVGMRHDGRMPPEIQSQTLEKLWMFNVHACVWENLYYISSLEDIADAIL
jgi:hypothetical protein